jgi:hypothetical protein
LCCTVYLPARCAHALVCVHHFERQHRTAAPCASDQTAACNSTNIWMHQPADVKSSLTVCYTMTTRCFSACCSCCAPSRQPQSASANQHNT